MMSSQEYLSQLSITHYSLLIWLKYYSSIGIVTNICFLLIPENLTILKSHQCNFSGHMQLKMAEYADSL